MFDKKKRKEGRDKRNNRKGNAQAWSRRKSGLHQLGGKKKKNEKRTKGGLGGQGGIERGTEYEFQARRPILV